MNRNVNAIYLSERLDMENKRITAHNDEEKKKQKNNNCKSSILFLSCVVVTLSHANR